MEPDLPSIRHHRECPAFEEVVGDAAFGFDQVVSYNSITTVGDQQHVDDKVNRRLVGVEERLP